MHIFYTAVYIEQISTNLYINLLFQIQTTLLLFYIIIIIINVKAY